MKHRQHFAFALAWITCSASPAFSRANEPKSGQSSNNIISLQLVQDFGLNHATNPCSMDGQTNGGFACFRPSGTQYHGQPLPDSSGNISAFPGLATTRILGGYDRLVSNQLLFGLRLGWVLRGGGPRPDGAYGPDFLPFHGEIRFGYVFGKQPFQPGRLQVSAFVNGGIAQVDTLYPLTIREDLSKQPAAVQLDNPKAQELAAYRKSGTGFAGAGITITYMISRHWGISASPKLAILFPSPGVAISLEAGAGLSF